MRPDAPQVLATVAMDLHEERSPNRTLAALTRHAWHLVGTGDAGLLTRRPDGSMRSAACTHRLVSRAHDLQIRLADGPSLSCMHDGTAIVVDDLATEQRWPAWAARATELNWRSMMAVALGTPDERVGVADFYAEAPGAFGPDELELGSAFARHASVALMSSAAEDRLRAQVDVSNMVGQAEGILMERYGVDAEHAFAMLRRRSNEQHSELRETAAAIIQTRRATDI